HHRRRAPLLAAPRPLFGRRAHEGPRPLPDRARACRRLAAAFCAGRHDHGDRSAPLPPRAPLRLGGPVGRAGGALSLPRHRRHRRPLPQPGGRSRRRPLRAHPGRRPAGPPEGARSMNATSAFVYRDGELCCEQVPLARLAERHGTPLYVYSRAALLAAFHAFDAAFAGTPHLVCFAVKANDHLAILHLFARAGAGFDVVSGGELWKALRAGADPGRIVFSGVGKTAEEIAYALEQRILMLNVESAEELEAVERIAARLGVRAPVALRVNPDVDPKTHPYIATGMQKSKFGIPIAARTPCPTWPRSASTATSARSSPTRRPSSTRSAACAICSISSPTSGSRRSCGTSTSAAAWASPTTRKPRPRRKPMPPRSGPGWLGCRSRSCSSRAARSSATRASSSRASSTARPPPPSAS